jgi:Spy/CpxP family protein refolding chaperone
MSKCSLSLLVIFLFTMQASGQDRQKKRPPRVPTPEASVVPAQAVLDRLDLSAEQKDRLTKLRSDFIAKNKDALSTAQEATKGAQEALKKAQEDKDRAAARAANEKLADANRQLARMREAFDDQVSSVLTAEQKKKYQELNDPATRRGRQGAGPVPGIVPVPAVLDKLGLSAEQKDKSAQLQREFLEKNQKALQSFKDETARLQEAMTKARQDRDRAAFKAANEKSGELKTNIQKLRDEYDNAFMKLLSPDQKKKYEELKTESPRKRRPGATLGGTSGQALALLTRRHS